MSGVGDGTDGAGASAQLARRLGDRLVEQGVVTRPQLEDASASARPGERLGSRLVTLGLVPADTVARALAAIQGVHAACASHFEAADPKVLALIPGELARQHCLFPIGLMGTDPVRLGVALLDPRDEAALQAVSEATGMALIPAVAPESSIRSAIAIHYASPGEARDTVTEKDRRLPKPTQKLAGTDGKDTDGGLKPGAAALAGANWFPSVDGSQIAAPPDSPAPGPSGIDLPDDAQLEIGQFDAGISDGADPGWDPYKGSPGSEREAKPHRDSARFRPPSAAPEPRQKLVLDAPKRRPVPARVPAPSRARVVPARQEQRAMGLQIAASIAIVLVVGGVVAMPLLRGDSVVKGEYYAAGPNVRVTLPATGWLLVPELDDTHEVGGAVVREVGFYRGGSVAHPKQLLKLGSVEVPMDIANISPEHFQMILRELERQNGQDVHRDYEIQEMGCVEDQARELLARCSGIAAGSAGIRQLIVYLWPATDRFLMITLLHDVPYGEVANEFREILDSVYYNN